MLQNTTILKPSLAPIMGPLLTIEQVQLITGKSRSTIYRWCKTDFPSQVPIGPNSVAWSTEEVYEWVNKKLQPISPEQGAH